MACSNLVSHMVYVFWCLFDEILVVESQKGLRKSYVMALKISKFMKSSRIISTTFVIKTQFLGSINENISAVPNSGFTILM